ncbi:SDR family oxidoreductase [Bordetella sp. BOR01]|nr:SDR family oxidoreductase [Bordetella sp. BOR01]
MDLGIEGKTAIVTASSSGLGHAIAHRLAREGCRIVLFARSRDKLETAAAELRQQHGVQALAVAGDMAQAADVDRLLAECAAFDGPDILVLNTGRPPLGMRTVLEETDDARWTEAYETQLWGAVRVARRIVPAIANRGWGRVIGVTSASVKQPMPKHALSTVYRAGVQAMLKHMANEVAAQGVTVNSVCPASIGTEALTTSYSAADRIKAVPLGRLGTPDELAAAVAFFASVQAGFITGASLHVDGGMVAALQ